MAFNLKNRSFLKEMDFTPRELGYLLKLSEALKLAKYAGTESPRLTGQEIALIFEKTSTRTRSSFEVAAYDQGAHVTYLDPSGSQLGHKESIADTAAVLGRMYDAIEYRGARQADVEALAAHAGVPVYNGLTAEWHPTQMLADFLTMGEASGKPYDRIGYAFTGDCRFNMARSLLVMGALMGSDVRLAGPRELQPPKDIVAAAEDIARQTGARITVPTTWPRPWPGPTSSTPTCGCPWANPRTSGRSVSGCSPPIRSTPACWRKAATRRSSSCTVCPRSTTEYRGRQGNHGAHRDDFRSGSDRRGIPIRCQHRFRPGREPAAHHQGRARSHPRLGQIKPGERKRHGNPDRHWLPG